MIRELIAKISRGMNLEAAEMERAVSFIAEGHASEQDIADLLLALAKKGETADEITGAARALRRYVRRVNVEKDVIVDTCGTGGDQKHTFNISTVSAFVAAGSGLTVAKHGNRSVSGSCGSADLLEALGVKIDVPVETIEKCINEIGIGFLFAPSLHPAFAHVQPVRRKLKVRTIFNCLGPLINPAFPTHQLVGVYEDRLVPVLAEALKNLGLRSAMVVWGEGGFDEVTTTGPTHVSEMSTQEGKEPHIKKYIIEPEKMGLVRVELEDLRGGDVEANKQIALNVLKGMEGPHRDVVVLNTGCLLYLAGQTHTIKEGMVLATETIDSGAAIKKLNKLIEHTNS